MPPGSDRTLPYTSHALITVAGESPTETAVGSAQPRRWPAARQPHHRVDRI